MHSIEHGDESKTTPTNARLVRMRCLEVRIKLSYMFASIRIKD